MAVELSPNHLYALTRTDSDAIQYSNSTNNGKSWDIIKKFNAIGATTASRVFIGKLASGHCLLVINNSFDRSNLTAYLSTDNCKTWAYKSVIANNPAQANTYPDVFQTTDGKIHVVYDYDRFGLGLILHKAFSESNLMAGTLSNIAAQTISKK